MRSNPNPLPSVEECADTFVAIPVTGDAVVEEIARFTDIERSEVSRRVWMEAFEQGWNVNREMRAFGATPHVYNQQLEALYREGTAFIFETMVYWCRPRRQKWSRHAVDRIHGYAREHGVSVSELSILLLGDGTGNDAIYLAKQGCRVDYFEIPGSQTYEFAMRRFEHYGLLDGRITLVSEYSGCFDKKHDVIISFEVLEHLVDPVLAIKDFARMLKIEGIALVTEAFDGVHDYLPTHLMSNEKFSGRTPFLHLRHDLKLSWYSREPLFKPMEFVRVERSTLFDHLVLACNGEIARKWLRARAKAFVRGIRGSSL